MVEIDEFREYCEFGPERVYLLMAISRSKDNEGSDKSLPVIRKIVDDAEALPRKVTELDHAASRFDERFRLYLSANARNTTKAFFQLRTEMDDWLRMRLNGDTDIRRKFKQVDSEFKSVLQSNSCKDETNFIFDLDNVSESVATDFEQQLEEFTTILLTRSTPNGYHIVTDAFNYNELETDIEYEMKPDDMIFVSYIGE